VTFEGGAVLTLHYGAEWVLRIGIREAPTSRPAAFIEFLDSESDPLLSITVGADRAVNLTGFGRRRLDDEGAAGWSRS
jgi:hypothetical protein